VTNILTQVGASELPFGAISNMQVLSGGYGSEFGRSTGGVVNITTKSGGNNFHFGGKLATIPGGLKGSPKNTYYPNTGANPDTDGKLLYWNEITPAPARSPVCMAAARLSATSCLPSWRWSAPRPTASRSAPRPTPRPPR
jgi:hypothetical protein